MFRNLLALAFLLSSFWSSAKNLSIESTRVQLNVFEKNTADILKRAETVARKNLKLMEQVGDLLEAHNSAKPIFQSGLLNDFVYTMEQSIIVQKAYMKEFEKFLTHLPPESSCHSPELTSGIQEIVGESERALQVLKGINNAQPDEEEAVIATLFIMMKQGNASILTHASEVVKTCLITDIVENHKTELENLGISLDSPDDQATEKALPDSYEEEVFSSTIKLTHDDSLNINQFLPVSISELSEMSSLELSKGLSVDSDFSIVLPESIKGDHTQGFAFSIKGTQTTGRTKYNIDIFITIEGWTPIDDLVFSDPQVKSCVSRFALEHSIVYVEKLTELHCQFSNEQSISLVDLNHLKSLKSLLFIGGHLIDLERVQLFSRLEQLQIQDAKVHRFPDTTFDQMMVVLNNVTVEQWDSLGKMKDAWITVSQIKNCKDFAPLSKYDHVFLVYKGIEQQSFSQHMDNAEDGKLLTTIVLDECQKEDIFGV